MSLTHNDIHRKIQKAPDIKFYFYDLKNLLKEKFGHNTDTDLFEHIHVNLEKGFNEYIESFFTIKYFNINLALSFINNNLTYYDTIYFNHMENKISKIIFNDYNPFYIIQKYKELVYEILYTNIDNYSFLYNSSFGNIRLDDINQFQQPNAKLITLLKYIQNTHYQHRDSIKYINIIDIYLNDFKGTPQSSETILNYIFFLRHFPLFCFLFNHYLSLHEEDLYKLIVDNELDFIDNINTQSPIIFQSHNLLLPDLFFLDDVEQEFYNLDILFENNISLTKLFYHMPIIKKIAYEMPENTLELHVTIYNQNIGCRTFNYTCPTLKSVFHKAIYQAYRTITQNLELFGFSVFDLNGTSIIQLTNTELLQRILYNLNERFSNDFFIFFLYTYYLVLNKYTLAYILNISETFLLNNISQFVVTLYQIYDYLNLKQYRDLNALTAVYRHEHINIDPINQYINNFGTTLINQSKFAILQFHIISAYILCKNKHIFPLIDQNIQKLKLFMYCLNHFKYNNTNLYNLFAFLSTSTANIKLEIFPKNSNLIFEWLDEIYNELFKSQTKKKKIIHL